MSRLTTLDNLGSFEINGNSGGTFTATGARNGSCYRASSLASGTSQRCRYGFASGPVAGPFFFRIYFKADTLPSVEMRFAYISNTTTQDSGVAVYLTIDSGGLVRLYDEDGQIGSASSALSTGTYYRIEFEANVSGASGSHRVRARIDGTEFAGADNRAISLTFNNFYYGGNLHLEANTAGDFKFDDIAINDGTGPFEYSYPGDGAYVVLRPNAAGDNAGWTGDHTAVDETTPNDGTDFEASNTLNSIFDHNIDDTPGAIGSGDTIKLVAVNARFAGAGASANAQAVLRIKQAASGTVEESANNAINANNTTWRTNDPNNAVPNPKLTLYNLPGPSGDFWTKALLDTAQIGARISTISTNNLQITAIWLGVEYSAVARPSVDATRMMAVVI